jgi:hypothetical protein
MSPVRPAVAFTLVRHMSATFTTIRVAETAALRGTADDLDDLRGDRGIDADDLWPSTARRGAKLRSSRDCAG